MASTVPFFPAKSRQIDSLDLIDLIELPRDEHLSHAHTDRSHWFLGIVRVVSGDASITLTVPFSCESGFEDIHPLKQSLPPELGASDTGNAPEFFIRLLHLLNSGNQLDFMGVFWESLSHATANLFAIPKDPLATGFIRWHLILQIQLLQSITILFLN